MKKAKHIIIVLIVLVGCSKSKNKSIPDSQDSITIFLSKATDKTLERNIRLLNNDKVLSIVKQRLDNVENRNSLADLAKNYHQLKENFKFKSTSQLLLKSAFDKSDSINIISAYKNLGDFYYDIGLNDSSYYYFLKAEKIATFKRDSISLGEIYIDKAFVQLYESDFNGCEVSASKSLSFLKQTQSKLKIYDAYNLIGISSNELKNYDKALEYHNKAFNYLKENDLNNKFHLDASSLNNIGYVYQNLNDDRSAIIYFKKALNDKKLFVDNPSLYAMLLDNLAYSKFKQNDLNQLPYLFYKSLRIRDSLKLDFSGIILNKIHLSELYYSKRDTVKAKRYANEALSFSRKTKVSSDILTSLRQLSTVDHNSAALYSKEYIKINDSLQQEERKAKDRFARIAFETDEIIIEKDKLAEQNRSLLYFFIIVLFVGVLLFVIRIQRAKNRELLLKQQQQKANEDIYNLMISQQATIEENRVKEKKRIAQELHDGVLGRLFGARLNLDSLNKFTDNKSIEMRFNYLEELKNIEQDIREISHDLSKEKFALINNFVAIVNNLVEEQKSSFTSIVTFIIDESIKWEMVSNSIKIHLYRILQESLQNINKYANAKHVNIELAMDQDSVILKIVDDGDGFDLIVKKKGIGIQNMISRTAECKGLFNIKSKRGQGTCIEVNMPIQNQMTLETS